MPEKMYVEVVKFAAKDLYDDKLKNRFVDLATSTAQKAVASAGYTTDKPTGKDAKGWSVNGSLTLVGPDKSGKKFVAKASAAIATWPGKSIKSMPSGEAGFDIEPGEKVSPGDADQLVKAATTEAMKSALAWMKGKRPD
jgi:hypothetical protein